MARRYTTTLSLSIGGDVPPWEGEATVSYLVTWGCAETPPAYSHGGLPADPDEVDDIRVEAIDGRKPDPEAALSIAEHIELNDDAIADMLAEATAWEADDAADAADRRYEDKRERL